MTLGRLRGWTSSCGRSTWPSRTASTRCCATSPSTSNAASSSRWSGRTGRGSRRCCDCSSASCAPKRVRSNSSARTRAGSPIAGAWATCRSGSTSRPTCRRPSRRSCGRAVSLGAGGGGRRRRPTATPSTTRSSAVALADLRRRPVLELSGGQQQRVLIAKALVGDPELLVLDEPIAGVDAESQRLFRDSLVHLVDAHGATVLLVSHELGAVADDLDRVIVLKRSVVFDGKPADLVSRGVSLGSRRRRAAPVARRPRGDRSRSRLPWPFDREYMQSRWSPGLTVGACAPLIGAFLVQKRMSLMGDGIGHLAFAGVAAGLARRRVAGMDRARRRGRRRGRDRVAALSRARERRPRARAVLLRWDRGRRGAREPRRHG